MTYFEDQEDAWYRNNCKGRIEDQDPDDIEGGSPEIDCNCDDIVRLPGSPEEPKGQCANCGRRYKWSGHPDDGEWV